MQLCDQTSGIGARPALSADCSSHTVSGPGWYDLPSLTRLMASGTPERIITLAVAATHPSITNYITYKSNPSRCHPAGADRLGDGGRDSGARPGRHLRHPPVGHRLGQQEPDRPQGPSDDARRKGTPLAQPGPEKVSGQSGDSVVGGCFCCKCRLSA